MGLVQVPNNRFLMDNSVAIHGSIEKYHTGKTEPVAGEFIQFTTHTKPIVTKSLLDIQNTTVKPIPIDKHTVLLTYVNNVDDTLFGVARIATIRLNDIQFSEPIIFSTAQITNLSITKLNEYTFLLAYVDGVTGFGNISMMRVLNNEASLLSTIVVSATLTNEIHVISISEMSALVAFYTRTGYAQFSRLTIIDNEIDIDEPFIFNTTVTSHISLAKRPDNKAIAIAYIGENNNVYVQQVLLGQTWTPSNAYHVGLANTLNSISPIQYLTNTKVVIGLNSTVQVIDQSENVLSFDTEIALDSTVRVCGICIQDSNHIAACVTNNSNRFGVYTITGFNGGYNSKYTSIASETVVPNSINIVKISEALAIVSYSTTTDSKISLLAIEDVCVEPSSSTFTTEGITINNENNNDIIEVCTIEDQLTSYVNTHLPYNESEPITVGDFVNCVDNYSLNEYGVSEENVLHDLYPSGQDLYHYGLFGETTFIKIDESRMLLIYVRTPITLGQSSTVVDIGRVCVQICRITGTTVEFGNIIILNDLTPSGADSTYYGVRAVNAVVLGDDRILVAYGNGYMDPEDDEYGGAGGLWSSLLSFADITLTRITPDRNTATKLSTTDISVTLLKVDNTHVVAQFGKQTSMITTDGNTLTITPTNISFGLYYLSGGIASIRYAMLDQNRMVVVANHQTPENASVRNSLRLYIYNFVDGMVTSVNVDTPYFILGSEDKRLVRCVGLAKLDDHRIAVSYAITDETDKYVHVLDISANNTVTELSKAVYHTGQLFFTELNTLTPNKILITFIENSSRVLMYRIAYIDNDGVITVGDSLTLPRTANTMYTTALNPYKSISLYPVNHDSTPYRQAYHLRLRVVGTDGSVPDFNVTELINDNSKITRSNTTSDAYGFVRDINLVQDENGNTIAKEYDIYEINPFMDRVKNQTVVECKVSEPSDTINPGDFIQFVNMESSPIEIAKSSTIINGVAIEHGNPSDLIHIRTLFKQ